MITTISKLKVGQTFHWIPDRWYGKAKLTSKTRQTRIGSNLVAYDLVFDAKVVNPPGIDYGVPGNTKVRVITRRKK